jgi:hypothetical protein
MKNKYLVVILIKKKEKYNQEKRIRRRLKTIKILG